jgi:hypothetical protein
MSTVDWSRPVGKCLCSSNSVVFSLGLPVSSTNKTDRYDIAEILLKVALCIIKPNQTKPITERQFLKSLSYIICFISGEGGMRRSRP